MPACLRFACCLLSLVLYLCLCLPVPSLINLASPYGIYISALPLPVLVLVQSQYRSGYPSLSLDGRTLL